MTSFASRALLPVGLVVGIVSGCARAHGKSQGDMADTTPSTPSPPSSPTTPISSSRSHAEAAARRTSSAPRA